MKIYFDVIGCRLNQSEVEEIANTFRALGHQVVADPAGADLAIVNTCAVTVKAAADSRKSLRRAGREGARQVIATGCWASLYPDRALDLPGVSDVVTNEEKEDLVSRVLGLSPEVIRKLDLAREPLPGDRSRTRAFIKVQEGCDNHCTYCLTRLARGKSRSRTLEQIDRDIRAALEGDVKEIVLTGVQLGAWGRDLPEPLDLTALLRFALAHPNLKRLRLSSIEPWDLTPDMLVLWEDPRLCRHLHIPLQSGSDSILKAMGRPITRADYADLVAQIREKVPEIAVTADVIAGFPGEAEAAFEDTRRMIREVGFADGHVFTYSPRPGTAAIKMKAQVPMSVAKARNADLRDVFGETGHAYREMFIGRVLPVLWESAELNEVGAWQLSGLTDTYIRVYATAGEDLWNQISPVRLQAHHPQRKAMIGEIQTSP